MKIITRKYVVLPLSDFTDEEIEELQEDSLMASGEYCDFTEIEVSIDNELILSKYPKLRLKKYQNMTVLIQTL